MVNVQNHGNQKGKTYLIRLLATGFKLHKAAVRRLGQRLNFFELRQKAKALSRSKLVLLHWTHWSCANGKGITLIDIIWGFGPISSPGWVRFSVLKRTWLFHKWQRTVALFLLLISKDTLNQKFSIFSGRDVALFVAALSLHGFTASVEQTPARECWLIHFHFG